MEIAKERIIKSDLEPIEGIKELLSDLKNKNIPAAIASSSPRDFIEIVVAKFELEEKAEEDDGSRIQQNIDRLARRQSTRDVTQPTHRLACTKPIHHRCWQ